MTNSSKRWAPALISSLLLTGTAMSTQALADGWSGEAEAGAISTSGNTDNDSFVAKADVEKTNGPWIHNILADTYSAKTSGNQTADRFSVGYKPKRLINDRTYAFGLANYDEDEFANIDDRTRLAVGVGHWFIKDERTILLGEAGLGARSTSFLDGTESNDDGIIYLHGKYKTRVLENADFIASVSVDAGSDNTFTDASLGLQVGLGGALALKATYSLRRNSDIVGVGGEKDDAVTGLTLVYGIGGK